MTKYVLEITKPDERYCDGCPCISEQNDCYITGQYLTWFGDFCLTPPQCPLVKEEEK
jgi:hypothetical protein